MKIMLFLGFELIILAVSGFFLSMGVDALGQEWSRDSLFLFVPLLFGAGIFLTLNFLLLDLLKDMSKSKAP